MTGEFDDGSCEGCLYACPWECSAPQGIFYYAAKNNISCLMKVIVLET